MIEQRSEGREGSPFLRTLHGGAGVPGSEVVTNGSGKVFKLGKPIGASGNVFELDESPFAEPVVIKLFPHAAGIEERAVSAFAQTALRAAGLRHPHIARVFDAGALENGTPFLVVEKLSGETLGELLSQGAALPPGDSLSILRAVGSALTAAHAAGIVHGELRPDNVFALVDGMRDRGGALTSVKLLDFGAARLTAPLRQLGMVGSDEALAYLGPEQLQLEIPPESWDGRADEYALAVLAHRLLAHSHSRRSPALTAVLTMAMNQKPDDRFVSVEQFLGALEEVSGAKVQPASVSAREKLHPLGDMDITPVGGPSMRMDPMALRTPTTHESNRSYGALTRQFFEDGNRMSEEAAAARLRRSSSSLSMSAASMRIPTSAARKVAVVVAAAAVIGVVAAAWAGVWNPVMAVRERAHVLFSPRPSIVTASTGVAPGAMPSEVARAPSPSEPNAPAIAKTAAPAGASAPKRVPTVDRAALEPPPPPAEAGRGASKPGDTAADERAAPSSSGRASRRARSSTRWSDPLHGYVWSPTEQRLVPSERAETAAPSAWPPPPPPESSPASSASSPSPSPSPSARPAPRVASRPAPDPTSAVPTSDATSSSLLDRPMPLSSSGPTEPPPQPSPPIIDDSDDGAPASATKAPARAAPAAPSTR
ncbi:MAG TPA: serine/threonine-protein kinase [Polyangia bacterium]|nr:serine/threonine-protein kinase [Polyangia bacterium]